MSVFLVSNASAMVCCPRCAPVTRNPTKLSVMRISSFQIRMLLERPTISASASAIERMFVLFIGCICVFYFSALQWGKQDVTVRAASLKRRGRPVPSVVEVPSLGSAALKGTRLSKKGANPPSTRALGCQRLRCRLDCSKLRHTSGYKLRCIRFIFATRGMSFP
jgi:hypothetical protein